MTTRTPRILIVEDDLDMLMLLETVLNRLDADIVTVGNGREALAVLEADARFAAIVADIMMPEMDGIELTRAVRQRYGDLPVIIVSASTEKGRVAIMSGADRFLQKPCPMTVLV